MTELQLQSSVTRSIKRRLATGPRTAAGKTRSRRNAYRHGLAVPVGLDPLRSPQVDKVAIQIVGPAPNETVMQIARRVAEAQLDVVRCRQARCRAVESAANQNDDLLEDGLDDRRLREYVLKTWWGHLDKGLPEADLFSEEQEMVIARHQERIHERRDRMHLHNLTVIDRYERRALSRRNQAIQDLDCQRILEATQDKPQTSRVRI